MIVNTFFISEGLREKVSICCSIQGKWHGCLNGNSEKILFWTFLSKACLYKKTGQAETVKRKGVCENEVGGISKDTVGYGGDGVWT